MGMTRVALRHTILRARNARVAAGGPRTSASPALLRLAPGDWEDVLADGDTAERDRVDFEGTAFMGVPVLQDPGVAVGQVVIDWRS